MSTTPDTAPASTTLITTPPPLFTPGQPVSVEGIRDDPEAPLLISGVAYVARWDGSQGKLTPGGWEYQVGRAMPGGTSVPDLVLANNWADLGWYPEEDVAALA